MQALIIFFLACGATACGSLTDISDTSASTAAAGNIVSGNDAPMSPSIPSTPTTTAPESVPTADSQAGVAAEPTNAMWVWNTTQVIAGSPENVLALLAGAKAAHVTDLYLYMAPSFYTTYTAAIAAFNTQAQQAGLRVWGLDGDRAYFADAVGPAKFYQGIDNLVAFNAAQENPNSHFYGFHADNEPHDSQGYTSFHNDFTDSALSTTPGSGVWQATQAQDREMLMRDWLTMHSTAQAKLHAAGLHFGAAMPSWTSDYYGQALQVQFPDENAVRRGVMESMMGLVDAYVIMSFNTDPHNAAARCLEQLQYASSLPAQTRPKVLASVETNAGLGTNVSYADTPGKASREAAMQDIQTMTETLRSYPAFAGVSIQDWTGWQALAQ